MSVQSRSRFCQQVIEQPQPKIARSPQSLSSRQGKGGSPPSPAELLARGLGLRPLLQSSGCHGCDAAKAG